MALGYKSQSRFVYSLNMGLAAVFGSQAHVLYQCLDFPESNLNQS